MTAAGGVRTVCPYCGVGCGMVLQVEGGRVIKVSGDKAHPANFGRLCTKGTTSAKILRESGRLDAAYVRADRHGEHARVPMEAAIAETARRLRHVLETHGPDALSFYVSGQMSIEAQYLINKLAKGYVGTNNIDSNSRLCMSSAASGYKLSLGADGPPGSYQDLDRADVFFVIGANMADCHPILFLRVLDRVKAGGRLIVVDPRRTATADKADLFMQIKPGTDLILLNGLLHLIHRNGHLDEAFIRDFTEGWDAMPPFLEAYAPERVAELTGIPEADIRTAAQWIGEAGNWVSCWTMGLNQSTHGTWNTNSLCNLHLATGAICRPGSGPFSLTGQPNAMGGREVGYLSAGLPGQRVVSNDADRRFIEELWHRPAGTIQRQPGADAVTMFDRLAAGDIRACWIICTNPVATIPNRQNVIAGLERADLVITQDAFLDTETNRYADILLPGALWAEGDGVMINSERNMTLLRKAVDPPGEALPDWEIVARVAVAMGFAEGFTYRSAADVFDEIRRTWNPASGYDIRGISHARLQDGPVQWPCPPDAAGDRHPMRYLNDGVSQTLHRCDDGQAPRLAFPTPAGRARFIARPHLAPAELPDLHFPMILNTGRLPHQWHTGTKTGKIDTLNKLNPGPFIEINPDDARALGIAERDAVEVRSRRGRAVLPAVVTDRVLPGTCFSPFHWNDVFGESLAINAVTNDAVDPLSLQPEFKFCSVALARVETSGAPVKVIGGAQQVQRRSTMADALVPVAGTTSRAQLAVAAAFDGSKIDTVASLLDIEDQAPPVLAPAERRYVSGFITGLRARTDTRLPEVPADAPIDADARLWLNGLLAGMFSSADSSTASPASARGDVVTLLWASQTGNAEALAARLASRLRDRGHEVRTACMADYEPAALPRERVLLLISSTYGDGEAPDNGRAFWDFLRAETAPRLHGLRYAVLALGDPSYQQFCQHGKNLDARLAALGAEAVVARSDCDQDYETPADTWLQQLCDRLQATGEGRPEPAARRPAGTPRPRAAVDSSRTRPAASRLVANVRLNEGAAKDTRHVSLTISETGLSYEAGDALGVWPSNCPELVAEILMLTRLRGTQSVNVADVGDMALSDALSQHFEIARPTSDVLRLIAGRTPDPTLTDLLSRERNKLQEWLWGRQLADVLHDFPVELSAEEFLGALRRLQPRLYSISSSPKVHTGEVHLTIAAVRYRSRHAARKGVSSTFLADRAADVEIPVFVRPSPHFRPPSDPDTAMIMVGPGTGVAPFRAFLSERRARGDRGPNWLFFGEQHSATGFYYRDEIEFLQEDGLLTRVSLAFSRDQAKKIYVQNRMIEHGKDLWRWLQDGAYFYVCGEAGRMAKAVERALCEIAQRHGGLSETSATEYVQALAAAKRYVRDVY